jgi:hypothetical protein
MLVLHVRLVLVPACEALAAHVAPEDEAHVLGLHMPLHQT